ncbi:retroviral-like aspartic protease family protein [Altericista sp. CCNU0014]|uniref:retroviral-like aspartic protease family protein n=1 Tax=Altericista sp. CCNU0014 TaxID=3082949 RepID=UPI0038517EEC
MIVSSVSQNMGKVTTTLTVANWVDEILAERGFIQKNEIRSLTLENVLVDTGASRLCLPKEMIQALGLKYVGENDVKTALGPTKFRVFAGVRLEVAGREGRYDCVELPEGSDPLLGLIPLEDLGLEPDLQNQALRVLPIEGKNTYLMVY